MANPKQNRQKKPRKDWRRVVVAALAAFLALMMLLPMFTMVLEAAQAADTSELEQQIREYQKQQADLAAQIKDLDRQLKSIAGDKAQALEQKRLAGPADFRQGPGDSEHRVHHCPVRRPHCG